MSLADELLDSLTENQPETRTIDPTTEPHIVINADRSITVPEELKNIAVQYDNGVETVTFDCPRYWDGHDLSKLTIYINYERKDKTKGRYPAKNIRVDDADPNMIHFEWTLRRHATEVFGDLVILACAKSVDSDGNEKEHWNSQRNEDLMILEGLECDEDITGEYPDEIVAILGRLSELENAKTSIINARDYGIVGDGATDDYAALQAAIDASHELGIGTVSIPTGRYLLSDALKFYSNQRIVGEPGATLIQRDAATGGEFGNLMRNYYTGAGGYDATENVIIENLVFDGGNQEEAPSTLLTFCHTKNIVVKDCTFQNGYSNSTGVGNGHDLEINSSTNVLIDRCAFVNNRRTGYLSELIQVDSSHQSGYPWSADEGESTYDSTVSSDVKISHCYFEGAARDNLTDRNCFVGGHTTVSVMKNIVVEHCTMRNAAYGVKFYAANGLVVRDNEATDVHIGVYIDIADTGTLAVGNVFSGNVNRAYPSSKVTGYGNVLNGMAVEKIDAYTTEAVDKFIEELNDTIYAGDIHVSGAKIGQFLKVSEVDKNGVPTAWEVAEPPVAPFRLLREVTIPDDITTDMSGVSFMQAGDGTGVIFEFDADSSGNPFNVRELYIVANVHNTSTSRAYMAELLPNGKTQTFCLSVILGSFGNGGSPGNDWSYAYLQLLKGHFISYGWMYGGGGSAPVNGRPLNTQTDIYGYDVFDEGIYKIKLQLTTATTNGFSSGSTFAFYGR